MSVPADMRIQRLVTDEPQGVLVGFRLTDAEAEALGGFVDEWDVEADDGGADSVPVWTADGRLEIRPEPTPDEMAEGVVPLGPDLEVWRSRGALDEWLDEAGMPRV